MKVFYDAGHHRHSPNSFYLWGQFLAFTPDPPARAESVLSALKSDGHLVLAAAEHGLRPVSDVHTPEYLQFLQGAWRDWQKAAETTLPSGLLPDAKDVYPLIFPVRGVDARYPSSILGRAGYQPACERSFEVATCSQR